MLTRKVREKNRVLYNGMLEEEMAKKLKTETSSKSLGKVQSSIESFVEYTPSFEKNFCYLGLCRLTSL